MDAETEAGGGGGGLSAGDAAGGKGNENPPALFYRENGFVVFTAAYHLTRGSCCGSGCRHCPFSPAHVAGSTDVAEAFAAERPTRRSA